MFQSDNMEFRKKSVFLMNEENDSDSTGDGDREDIDIQNTVRENIVNSKDKIVNNKNKKKKVVKKRLNIHVDSPKKRLNYSVLFWQIRMIAFYQR